MLKILQMPRHWFVTCHCLKFRLEEEEKFLNAESYYKKALALDETFKDAEDALQKLHKYMQVILYFLLDCYLMLKFIYL